MSALTPIAILGPGGDQGLTDIGELRRIAVSNEHDIAIRAAAIDRFAELTLQKEPGRLEDLLTELRRSHVPESLDLVIEQWKRELPGLECAVQTLGGPVATRGPVRTRGAVGAAQEPSSLAEWFSGIPD